jgi:BMFP domain-containing protein YqiC
MQDRPRFFDDLAGVAGGAFSALSGLRDEAETLFRGQKDEALRRLDLVRRTEFDAVAELAANARAGQEAADARLAALEQRIAALEALLGATPTLAAAAAQAVPESAPPQAAHEAAQTAASEAAGEADPAAGI